jgi:hypothetical protein
MKAKAQIGSFKSVEPESGWLCEYSLNGEEAFVRFKRSQSDLELEIEGRGNGFQGAKEEPITKGYAEP